MNMNRRAVLTSASAVSVLAVTPTWAQSAGKPVEKVWDKLVTQGVQIKDVELKSLKPFGYEDSARAIGNRFIGKPSAKEITFPDGRKMSALFMEHDTTSAMLVREITADEEIIHISVLKYGVLSRRDVHVDPHTASVKQYNLQGVGLNGDADSVSLALAAAVTKRSRELDAPLIPPAYEHQPRPVSKEPVLTMDDVRKGWLGRRLGL